MIDSSPGPAETSRRPDEPTADEVRAQVRRILSSAAFAQSDRLKRFLCYAVEEALAGRGPALKEYTIAIDVFERDQSFDPQTSSIVRVEASRLRAKLEKYNAIEGREDPVRIRLPPGRYVPTFEVAGRVAESAAKDPPAAPWGAPGRWVARRGAVLLGVVVLALGAAAVFLSDPGLLGLRSDSATEASRPAGAYSVAVLPLRNLSPDRTEDYFSDGITDALITGLAKGGRLRVTSMTSAMAYKNADRSLADVARELGVSHVVEGSVQRVGDTVRITAQLIEVETDRHLWAESYEGDASDVLGLQDRVVGSVVSALSGRVAPGSDTAPAGSPSIDPAAYEAALKGRYFLNKMTEDGFRKGIAYFKQAIAKAPDYAPAYSGIATCYCLLGGHGFELVKPSEGMPAAKTAVLEALRLDDTLAEAHAFLGIIRLKYEWDWPGAEQAFLHSIALNPSYAQARIFYSFYLEAMGRQAAAIREAVAARANDPLSLAANVNLGWQYLQAGRLEEAREIFEDTAELNPGFWGVHWGLGHYHRRKGEVREAVAAFQKAVAAGGGHALPLSALGYTYAVAGQRREAQQVLDRLAALAEETYVSPYNMAVVHAGLGNTGEAFAWLEKAYAHRSRSMAWLNAARELDGLRSDPRFGALVRRVGLPS